MTIEYLHLHTKPKNVSSVYERQFGLRRMTAPTTTLNVKTTAMTTRRPSSQFGIEVRWTRTGNAAITNPVIVGHQSEKEAVNAAPTASMTPAMTLPHARSCRTFFRTECPST